MFFDASKLVDYGTHSCQTCLNVAHNKIVHFDHMENKKRCLRVTYFFTISHTYTALFLLNFQMRSHVRILIFVMRFVTISAAVVTSHIHC